MRGFCHKGVILFPKVESYEYKEDLYKINLAKAVKAIIQYLKEKDIAVGALTTDETAILVNPADVYWMQTLPDEDAFFVKNNCENMGLNFTQLEKYEDLYKDARLQLPVARGLSPEQRFEIVNKRNDMITKKLLEDAKLIVHFTVPNFSAYKVKPKEMDGKIFLVVNSNNFMLKCYLNGHETDSIPLLEVPYANRPLHQWEVLKNG